ncbi:TetR/AcrR family transcriptional regulator [Candidatus Thiodiazotropha sp. CDECU1]|uniref:TetR/AcrR family transcriptional regulator n=1 Tax=Candidatus Thiodiazotropha sp. CDECU1 TaxID=3065865 RepID=UPI00292F5F49|nr:TetR/AcrR family transcriptional regulator [Candidatus Thiodiazotropha sp. CDECU1]
MGRRGEHSKSEIECMALEAAEAIIEGEGYDGLSARKVASAIGYTVGSLYFVFRNLDELIQRINGRTLDQLYAVQVDALTHCRLPQQCVLALASVYIDFAARHPHRWRMVFEHQPRDDGLSMEIYREKVERLYELVEKQLKALAARPDEEIALAARALWNGVHGIATMTITRHPYMEGKLSGHQLSMHLINHYLTGFRTTEINSVITRTMGQAIDYPK